jgi:hypothetical protein
MRVHPETGKMGYINSAGNWHETMEGAGLMLSKVAMRTAIEFDGDMIDTSIPTPAQIIDAQRQMAPLLLEDPDNH